MPSPISMFVNPNNVGMAGIRYFNGINMKHRKELEAITKTVAEYYKMQVHALRSEVRTKRICHIRHIAMYFCCLQEYSLMEIARYFNRLDHTSIIYARNKVKGYIDVYPDIAAEIGAINELLNEQKTAT